MSEETVDIIRKKFVNSLKKSRKTSFETHNSLTCYTETITNETQFGVLYGLACYAETITNETQPTATCMDFFGLFTIFQMHFQVADQRSASRF